MSVLAFRTADTGKRRIPKPLNYQPEAVYSTVELQMNMAGFLAGCEFYVKHDFVIKGCPHLVVYQGSEHVGYITDYGPRSIAWSSLDPQMPSRVYEWPEVRVVGAIIEIWSFGIGPGRPRWVFDETRTGWGTADHLARMVKFSVG